ncbi:hypothetical protein CVT24_012625 [Panaeolus cyanescens]|uniref:Phosphatidylinositol-specific phospholipase C X domain-containing protein n=1 Tax=Panaeolus cyanescens TaxID=181874 RepID=A0A409W680_9AGAR|nr:hypothetical protein CVT24_012625 [Panaeolus cyanescens]
MAPDTSKRWMQTHRPIFGELPISELCMPGSHDAGTYRRGYHTIFGTESNVITQTRSIFDQLELGVRYFDIRPCLTSPKPNAEPGNWACGHFTGEASDKIGWQGANCMEIREVIDEVNRFTQDNAELVIVEISHIYRVFIDNPKSSTARDPNDDEWNSLLNLLSEFRNLFTVDRAGGAKDRLMRDYTLNQFIGDGKAAVIVLVDGYPSNRDNLYNRGLWPMKLEDDQHRLSLRVEYLTRTATPTEAVLSTLDIFQLFGPDHNYNSVLSLAKRTQEREFPWLLQRFAGEGYPSVIWMDRIQNADPLTFCIATSYQHFNRSRKLNNMVVVYGGFLVTSSNAHDTIRNAIDSNKSLRVTNDTLGCDPWPGMTKSCAVFYERDGLVKARFARENYSLHFEQDVLSIEYGNRQIHDQNVYLRLLRAIASRTRFTVDNNNLGGDPQPGVVKKCVVRFRDMNDDKIREEKADEGKTIDFETWIEKLGNSLSNSHMYH